MSLNTSSIPILAIVIVAYKSQSELPGCLGSVPRELLGRPIEVCVVNNSPGDGVAGWMAREYPAMRCYESGENLGFGRANNLGYRNTSGECVLFLNPDTVCNLPALEHCVRRIITEPELGLISPKLVQADGTMDLACRRSIPTLWDGFCRATGLAAAFPRTAILAGYNLTHLPEAETYAVGAINGAFMLARRAVLEKVADPDGAVFDENYFMYGDDLDLCIRMSRMGMPIIYDGRVQIIHLKGLSVAKDYAAMSVAIFDANRDVYIKHFGQTMLSRVLYGLAFAAWKLLAKLRAFVMRRRRVRPI